MIDDGYGLEIPFIITSCYEVLATTVVTQLDDQL